MKKWTARKLHFALMLAISTATLFGQREQANWHFGCFAGLNFAEDGTVTRIPSSLQSREGTASISDEEGNVLFYSDGINIYNSAGAITVNTLLGDRSSTTAVAILPVTGRVDEYWLFTTDSFAGTNGTNYYRYNTKTEALVEGPIQLISNGREKLAALRKCDEAGFWLVTQDSQGKYLIYSVDVEVKLISSTTTNEEFVNEQNKLGQLKFSDSGKYLANVLPDFTSRRLGGIVQVYEFDPILGAISNPLTPTTIDLNDNGNGNRLGFPYGVAFSPQGRFLYVSTLKNERPDLAGGQLFQYDLSQTRVNQSRVTIGQARSPIGFGGMSLGVDGKIYLAIEATSDDNFNCSCRGAYPFLGVIENPDEAGSAAGFVQDGLALSRESLTGDCGDQTTGGAKIGLPFRIAGTYEPVSLDLVDQTICQGDSIRLLSGEPDARATYTITGPGFISQDYFLTVSPDTTTTYIVFAETTPCSMATAETMVSVIPGIGISILGNTILCPGDVLSLVGILDNPSVSGDYGWMTPNGGIISGAEIEISSVTAGTYTVVFTDEKSCNSVSSQV